MVVTAGAMAVGGGLLTVVSLRVVESVTMLLVSACAGSANNTADMRAHPLRLLIVFVIFVWIGFANLLLVFLSGNITVI
jgi:hypothetical protein